MQFRVLFWRGERHTTMRMFVGANDGARANCGDLVMRNAEFDAFRELAALEYVDKTMLPITEPRPEPKRKR